MVHVNRCILGQQTPPPHNKHQGNEKHWIKSMKPQGEQMQCNKREKRDNLEISPNQEGDHTTRIRTSAALLQKLYRDNPMKAANISGLM